MRQDMFMKIKDSSFNAIKPKKREKIAPKKQSKLLKGLINLISKGDFKKTEFKYVWTSGQDIQINQPCLILMNHSSFIDLEIFSASLRIENSTSLQPTTHLSGKIGYLENSVVSLL